MKNNSAELSSERTDFFLAVRNSWINGDLAELDTFKKERNLKAELQQGICCLFNETSRFVIDKLTCNEIHILYSEKGESEIGQGITDNVKEENIEDFEYLKEVIVDELFLIYVGEDQLTSKINYNKEGLTTILFVGVNGVGKTTSIAKLATKLKEEGKKVKFYKTKK